MNVVIYGRYSTEKQTEQSIEGQLKVCYEFAKRNDYVIVGEYIDRAMSGKSDDRPQFQKMIADSNRRNFQGILVYQLDRFARNRYDSATYRAKLKKNGVRVFSARENISDDASGIIMESVLEGMAEYYSVELAQKVKRGMLINAEKCLYNGGTIPFGYKIVDKRYTINEETAPYVQKIFEMYADGQRILDITNYLNARGLRSSLGARFNDSSLHTMLKNERYLGTYIFGDIKVPNAIPRIISDELFQAVAEVMRKNQKAPARARAKADYILTTKLFCGHCKSLMTGGYGTSSTGKKYYYYTCNNVRNKPRTCNKKNVSKEFIEDAVVRECRKLLTNENIEKIAKEVVAACESEKSGSALRQLEKNLRDNEKQKANLMQSLKICDIESVRVSIFEEMAAMEVQHADFKKAIAYEKAQYVTLTEAEIAFFLTQLKKGDINDIKYRKMLVTVFVNAIYLYDDGRMTLVLNSTDRPITLNDVLVEEISQSSDNAQRSCIDGFGSPFFKADGRGQCPRPFFHIPESFFSLSPPSRPRHRYTAR